MHRLFYTDHYEITLPAGHKFPMRKYRLVRELLADEGYVFEPAPVAARETIELVHDPEYVARFLDGTINAQAMRRIGFPWSEELVLRTLASVGGTLAATEDAVAGGFGGTLAGGTHHAFRGEGSGYCVFNDIAIAAEWVRREKGLGRVAVVDCDVHQGDGTAQIFGADDEVFTLSLHGRRNFPFRKQQSQLDIELEDETGDEEYLKVLVRALGKVKEFAPEIVFYQSGVDTLECDLLGRLSLTHGGLRERDRLVMDMCRELKVSLVITMGGGYGNPIEQTALAHANTFRTALEVFRTDS